MTHHPHPAIGRIRAGRFPAAHGGAVLPCQARKVVGQETVKSTDPVISLVPPALIRQGAALAMTASVAAACIAFVMIAVKPIHAQGFGSSLFCCGG